MARHRLFQLALLAAAFILLVFPATAQQPLTNANVKGTFNVRYYGTDSTLSDRPVAFAGTITFDGTTDSNGYGGYTVSGQGAYQGTTSLKFLTSGQYSVLPSGMFFMTNAFDPASSTTFSNAQTVVYGGVGANGVIIGSSTDTTFCDLLIGVPQATSASASTLNGDYYVGHMGFYNGAITSTRNSFFKMTANGSGSLGNISVLGTAQDLSNKSTTQTATGATYTVSNANGTGTIVFPGASGTTAAQQILAGTKTLYVSQDGNFFIAGDPAGFDMIVGVKALPSGTSASSALPGLYWEGWVENYAVGSNFDGMYSLQGSYYAVGPNVATGHQRQNQDGFGSIDYNYTDTSFAPGTDGTQTYSDSSGNASAKYVLGAGGNVILGVGFGTGGDYILDVEIKAPSISGTGVFLNPQYIFNAASYTPVTSGFAPGELISVYGSGFAPAGTQQFATGGQAWPTTLGGTQLLINGTAVPLYVVTPTQVSAQVPFNSPTNGSFLKIQVVSSGTTSNAAYVYSGVASPGIFTQSQNGIGPGAIRHVTDGSVVTTANPATVGEYVSIFLTGLGATTPAIAAGAVPSSTTLTNAVMPDVYIDGKQATVQFAGLTPGLAGLYQINVQIPAGVTSGRNNLIEIDSYDGSGNFVAWALQASIPTK